MAFTSGKTAFRLRGIAPAALSTLALWLTGCTLGTVQLSGPAPSGPATVAKITGKVIGGEQPVTGASLAIYTVGTGGYGPVTGSKTGATAISGATAFTDASGNFQFSAVTCTDANALTYIVATGGDPGLGTPTGFNTINDLNGGVYLLTLNNSGAGAPTYTLGSTVVLSGLTGSAAFLNGSHPVIGSNTYPNAATVEISGVTDTSGNTGYNTTTGLIDSSSNVNSAIKLVTASGTCGSLNSLVVNIDEITTAATAYALAQYIDPVSGQIGAPLTQQAQTAFGNALQTLPLLVNALGQAVPSTTLTGAGYTLTAVPESATLTTVANLIAACVNSTGSTSTGANCGTLFTNAGAGTATDTFGAAVEMAQQPYNTAAKVSALYGLQTAQSPFTGGLSATPTDWTLGIQYIDNTGALFIKPTNIAIDSLGDVWVLSNAGSSNTGSSVASAGALAEISPNGTPLSTINTLYEYGPFSTLEGTTCTTPVLTTPSTTTTSLSSKIQNTLFDSTFGLINGATINGTTVGNAQLNPHSLAIDPSNNVWFTSLSANGSTVSCTPAGGKAENVAVPSAGNVYQVPVSDGLPTGPAVSFAPGKSPYGLTIDSSGNVFTGESSSSTNFTTFEFPYNATPGYALLTPAGFPKYQVSSVDVAADFMAVDTSGNKWITDANANVFKLSGTSTASCTTYSAPSAAGLCQPTGSSYSAITGFSSTLTPYGIAEGTTGMWIADSGTGTGGNSVTLVPFGSTSGTSYGGNTYFTGPKIPAVDGAGNVWVPNSTAGTSATTTFVNAGSITEVSSSGTILSPSNGGVSSVTPGFTHTGINLGFGAAVDPSGNVWITNSTGYVLASAGPPAQAVVPTSIFEIIGSAVPVVTPIAAYTATGPTRP